MKSELNSLIGNRLIELRQSKELSQEKLANMAGLDRSYISRIERGMLSPSLENFFKICMTLEVLPCAFLEEINS